MNYTEISVAGTSVSAPSAEIKGKTIVATGRLLKVATVKDEDWQEGEVVPCPDEFVESIQQRRKELKADLFTFSQKPNDRAPRHRFYYEWESIAAIPIVSFKDWWTNRVSTDLRCDVRKAQKRGVVVRPIKFGDDLVRAITAIYDETPFRQGRPFWHYRKGFDAVKAANATYLERSEFLAAFLGDEVIGFLKIVYVDQLARLMQIISKERFRDKRPMNALIAGAVEVAAARGCSYLTYGNYRYSQGADTVTAFKKRNGFEEILVPRYYIPLTPLGRLALHLGLHRGAKALMPVPILRGLKRVRAFAYRYWQAAGKAT